MSGASRSKGMEPRYREGVNSRATGWHPGIVCPEPPGGKIRSLHTKGGELTIREVENPQAKGGALSHEYCEAFA